MHTIIKHPNGKVELHFGVQDGTEYTEHPSIEDAQAKCKQWGETDRSSTKATVIDKSIDPVVTKTTISTEAIGIALSLANHRKTLEDGHSYKMVITFEEVEQPYLGEGI